MMKQGFHLAYCLNFRSHFSAGTVTEKLKSQSDLEPEKLV